MRDPDPPPTSQPRATAPIKPTHGASPSPDQRALATGETTYFYRSESAQTGAAGSSSTPEPLAARYQEIAEIGRWPYGSIVEAEHLQLGRRVWLYKLDPLFAADPAVRDDVLETVRRAVAIDHPNVRVGIREAVSQGAEVWIVRDPDDDRPPEDLGPRWQPTPGSGWLYPNPRLSRMILEAARGFEALDAAGLDFDPITPDLLRCDPATGRLRLPVLDARLRNPAGNSTEASRITSLATAFRQLLCGKAQSSTDEPRDNPSHLSRSLRRANRAVSASNAAILGRCLATDSQRRLAGTGPLAQSLEANLRRQVELAPWPERLFTLLMDLIGILVFSPLFAAWGFLIAGWLRDQGLLNPAFSSRGMAPASLLCGAALIPVYVALWLVATGTMPGHIVRGLHLVDVSGSRPPRWRILDRFILQLLCVSFPYFLIAAIHAALWRDPIPAFLRMAAPVVGLYLVSRVLLSGRLDTLDASRVNRVQSVDDRPARSVSPRRWIATIGLLLAVAALAAWLVGAFVPESMPVVLPDESLPLPLNPLFVLGVLVLSAILVEITGRFLPWSFPLYDWMTGITWGLIRWQSPTHPAVLVPRLLPRRSTPVAVSPTAAATGPARHIEHYRLLRELGKGGMGSVYEAHDEVLQRRVALKQITPALEAGPDALSRFEQEARLAARIDHIHVARLFGVGQHQGRPYMVMEYVEGRTLTQLLDERGAIPVAAAWSYVAQAALGLRAANRLGIIHRDIKPSNLMLTAQGQVKVLDFGISTLVDDPDESHPPSVPDVASLAPEIDPRLTRTGALLGTPLYMSPEQALGKPLDARSDIYSLGLTLYHLLAGSPPFPPTDLADLVRKQCHDQPPPLIESLGDLTEEQAAVIDRMIAKDPAARYESYDDLLADLARTAPRPAEAAPPTLRAIAVLIDLILVGALPGWLNSALLGSSLVENFLVWLIPAFLIACLAWPGITPGKWLLRLRATRPDGQPMGVPRAALRLLIFNPTYLGNILKDFSFATLEPIASLISYLPFAAVLGWGVSVFLMASDPRYRALHDRAAGTVVVRPPRQRRRRPPHASSELKPPSSTAAPSSQTTVDLPRSTLNP